MELSKTFSVSQRTMLRDLHVLSESGVPLRAVPGPGGGYSLDKPHQLAPLNLTIEEAVALLISYESFLEYADRPFENENLSVMAKLLALLPADALLKIEELRKKVQVATPIRSARTPFLRPLLDAALAQQSAEIEYDSLQRISTRIIHPRYLYAFDGYWYCRCYCFLRQSEIALRVDRIKQLTIVEGYIPEPVDEDTATQDLPTLPLRIRLTRRGCKLADGHHQLSKQINLHEDGSGLIETTILTTEINWIVRFVLGLGQEASVEQPEEVIAQLQREITILAERYAQSLP
jgi:predicted DNA-binding transcriptional regulator YafY